jgi:hypothetical protein
MRTACSAIVLKKGTPVVGHESPDIVGVGAQAVDEMGWRALLGFAALAGRRRARVVGVPTASITA